MSSCSRHASKEAVGACINCGKLVCVACHKEIDGKSYCPVCLEKLFAATEVKTEQTAATLPAEKDKIKVPAMVAKETVAATANSTAENTGVDGLWWLAVVFGGWIGGVVAWLFNRGKRSATPQYMLLGGIGWSVMQGVVALIIIFSMVIAPAVGPQLQQREPMAPEEGITVLPMTEGEQPSAETTATPAADIGARPVEWLYTKIITQPITAVSGGQAISMGDLNSQKVAVILPGNTFDSNTQVTLSNPSNVPPVMSDQLTPLGVPIEISPGSQMRLNQPATVKLRVDKDKYSKDLQKGDIWLSYYNGKQWEYFMPDKSDAVEGTISFNTYHFCLFGYGKIDMEERISKYTNSAAIAELTQGEILDAAVNNVVANALEDLMLDKYNMDKDSLKSQIITSLVNDDEWGNIRESLASPDGTTVGEINKQLNVLVGKKIADNLEGALEKITDSMEDSLKNKAKEEFWGSVLGNLTSDTGQDLAQAGVEAAAYAWEGQPTEAARIVGEAIANSFMLTNIVRGAAEMVQGQIDQWKDKEIEAAYQVYKNGADGEWGYKYNVGEQNFQDLVNQMKGIATKIESDAVQNEIKSRAKQGKREATTAELDAVRAKAWADLKKQFESRAKKEAEIALEKSKLHKLIVAFDKDGLLDEGSPGYLDIMSVEQRLDSLLRVRDRIIYDTGRKGWNISPNDGEETIGRVSLIALIRAWFEDSTGEAYAKELKKRFPDVRTKLNIPAPQEEATTACDLTIDPASMEGEIGTQYTFKAKTGRTKNISFDWYIDGKKVQSGIATSISPTFKVEKLFPISVTMFENGKEVCVYKSSANVKKRAEQAPATNTTPTPITPTPTPTPTPVTPTPAPTGTGWYRDGAPVIQKNALLDSDAYFGKKLNISDGSASGAQSWKFSGCSGTLTGSNTWMPPPSFMKPGSTINFTASAKTTQQNTCGTLSISSSCALIVQDREILRAYDDKTPSRGTGIYTVEPGAPGAKMAVVVNVYAANLIGTVTYNYTYK